jgi:hypothetical protein
LLIASEASRLVIPMTEGQKLSSSHTSVIPGHVPTNLPPEFPQVLPIVVSHDPNNRPLGTDSLGLRSIAITHRVGILEGE